MSRLPKSRDYLMKCLGFVLLFGFISLGALGACDSTTSENTVDTFLGIHQTGQTTSHAPEDDGDLQTGVIPPEPRFTDNGDGTITDNLTGFLWTKDAGCVEETTWEETLEGASTIGDGDCGLTDGSEPGSWRVANVRELQSLVDYGNSPTLPPDHPFIAIDVDTVLWSSTTHDSNPDEAYTVTLGNGEILIQSKDSRAGCMLKSAQTQRQNPE